MAGPIGSLRSRSGRRRQRARPMSEINVTPFVDVMLVLLIVFMVTAPLLSAGVPVNLPEANAKPLAVDKEPVTVTIDGDGRVFIKDTEVPSMSWSASCRPRSAAISTSASTSVATARSATARSCG